MKWDGDAQRRGFTPALGKWAVGEPDVRIAHGQFCEEEDILAIAAMPQGLLIYQIILQHNGELWRTLVH